MRASDSRRAGWLETLFSPLCRLDAEVLPLISRPVLEAVRGERELAPRC